MDKPIITSLLDTDWYKPLMGNFAFCIQPKAWVKYRFINRTQSAPLARLIPIERLREELDHVRTLSYAKDEIAYLKSRNIFNPTYLDYLTIAKLPEIKVDKNGGQFEITTEGLWHDSIQWETIVLCIINQLYGEAITENKLAYQNTIGMYRLREKIDYLCKHPEIRIAEFGTRRRASKEWQLIVDTELSSMLSKEQLVGISNVHNAWKLGANPSGTFAHEIPMVYAGIYRQEDIAKNRIFSHELCLEDWYNFYGPGISVGLTDTYGSDYFFRTFLKVQGQNWKTLRQDSGDPFDIGEKAIKYYKEIGVDPMTKTMIFSDGLDLPTISKIANYFKGRINFMFGWGTNLTNDIGINNLQIVFKADTVNNFPVVKLSDNIYKATGDKTLIELYKKLAKYDTNFYKAQNY